MVTAPEIWSAIIGVVCHMARGLPRKLQSMAQPLRIVIDNPNIEPLRICTPGPLKYWSGETGSGVPNLYYLPVAAGTVVLNQ